MKQSNLKNFVDYEQSLHIYQQKTKYWLEKCFSAMCWYQLELLFILDLTACSRYAFHKIKLNNS